MHFPKSCSTCLQHQRLPHRQCGSVCILYLGTVLNNKLDLSPDIQRRVRLASSAFGRLSQRALLNTNLNLKTKMAVYNAVCASTLLYGYEAWVLYRRRIKTLEQFHISCLQRMLRLHWWYKVPHVQIRHRSHWLSMEAIVAERQLRWTALVIWMPENRLPRRVLYGELKEGRRSAGGQYKRFKDYLKATLKKNAIPLTNWKH